MSILVTRPGVAGVELVAQLRQQGLTVHYAPLITFAPTEPSPSVAEHLSILNSYAVVIGLSPRAPEYIQQALPRGRQLLWPAQTDYCAIGAASAKALQQLCGKAVDYPPEHSSSEALLELPRLSQVAGERVLLLRGQGGRKLIMETLVQRGAEVITCECYQRISIAYDGLLQADVWQRAAVDTIVVTSGEILQRLYTLVPQIQHAWLLQCRLVVVSRRIAALADYLGWSQWCVAEAPDNAALLRALGNSRYVAKKANGGSKSLVY